MKRRKVEIKELRVRVSGLSRSEGKRLGELLARSLSEVPPGSRSQKIPEVAIRLRRTGESVEPLAQKIAAKIQSRVP